MRGLITIWIVVSQSQVQHIQTPQLFFISYRCYLNLLLKKENNKTATIVRIKEGAGKSKELKKIMDREDDKNKENLNCYSSSSSSVESDPYRICLGPFVQESYLDTCFHKFCYNCILHWAKVVAGRHYSAPSLKCPFCKTENLSIVYGYDGCSFQWHYINENYEHRSFFSKAHKYRLQCYYTEPGILSDVIDVSRYWKSRKYLQANRWLQSWLRREYQALLQEEDVDIVVQHILGLVDSFLRKINQIHQTKTPETKQGEFKTLVSDAARRFLAARTDRFVNELELFLASGFNVEAYDEVYKQRLGLNTPRAIDEAVHESSRNTLVTPYLYIFDEDSDEAD